MDTVLRMVIMLNSYIS